MSERPISCPWDISVINGSAYTLVTIPYDWVDLPSPLRILSKEELQRIGKAHGAPCLGQWTHHFVNKASPRTLAIMLRITDSDRDVSAAAPLHSTITVEPVASRLRRQLTVSPITVPPTPATSPDLGPALAPALTTMGEPLSVATGLPPPELEAYHKAGAEWITSRFQRIGL